MKRIITFLMIVSILSVPCASAEKVESEIAAYYIDAPEEITSYVIEDEEFGSIYVAVPIDVFNSAGFEFGDSLDVEFANGFSLYDIPYYDGYYERVNEPVVVAYPGYEYVAVCYCSGDSMWDEANLTEGDKVTISLNEKAAYLSRQETMASTYSEDYAYYLYDAAVFSNFRAMKGGKLKENMFFRGASPIDDRHLRADIVDSLISETGIRFVLDLADNEKKIESYGNESPYFRQLIAEGNVALLSLSAAYRSDEFKQSLVQGFLEMMQHEGPYYIHCTEGKDRTGFACMLIEALCDASYEEIEKDYMITYDNYYGITEETEAEKYTDLKELRLHDMLWWLTGSDEDVNLSEISFKDGAKKYLSDGGMSGNEIEAFIDFLTK